MRWLELAEAVFLRDASQWCMASSFVTSPALLLMFLHRRAESHLICVVSSAGHAGQHSCEGAHSSHEGLESDVPAT